MHITLSLEHLCCRAVIGVRPHERRRPQPLFIDVSLEVDLPDLPAHDRLEFTVDYSSLFRTIAALVGKSTFGLIESLAHRVASLCLEDTRVRRAVVTVRKPRALRGAATAAVTVRLPDHA